MAEGEHINKEHSQDLKTQIENKESIGGLEVLQASAVEGPEGTVALLVKMVGASGGGSIPVVGTRTMVAPTTGEIQVPAGAKSISIYIVGDGAEIDGVSRPDGFARTFEISNVNQPEMVIDGNTTATIYVDYAL